ncbi:MAG: HEPN domain-containing protein [Candidatus Bathyarchaeota archaeon]|nr:HEPN domain-containing protein [Candidatus Bathyarchaeota archaeon]
MGTRVSFKFKRLLEERRLTRIKPDRKLVLKEIEGAKSDLETARKSLQDGNFKWAIIQGYYSIFHSARALVYSKGFREKSHYALLVAVQELFRDELETSLIQGFEDAMNLRQTADYGLTFSKEGAINVIETAERFLLKAKEILG